MRSLSSASTIPSVSWQVLLVVLCGLVLASLVSRGPLLVSAGAAVAVVLCIVLLQRPDVGLLIVLLVRTSTDVGIVPLRGLYVGPLSVGSLPNMVLMLMLLIIGGCYILTHNLPLLSLPGGRVLTLLLVTGLVGMVRSSSILSSFREWLPVVSTFIAYALAAHLFRTPRRMQTVLDVIAASFFLPAFFGLYQVATGRGSILHEAGIPRIFGTFAHPNAFGMYLVTILSVFVCQAFTRVGWRRFSALLITAVAAVLLVATFTRVAWVGALVVLLTVGALRHRALLLLVPLAAIAATAATPQIGERVADPLSRGGSLAERLEIWQKAFLEWKTETGADERPIPVAMNRLVGLGPGSVESVTYRARGMVISAHNDYLRVLIEYGIFGLLLHLTLLIVLIILAYRAWRESGDAVERAITLSFLALTLAYPVMSLTDHVFAQTVIQVYFWTLAGLTAAIAGSIRGENGDSST